MTSVNYKTNKGTLILALKSIVELKTTENLGGDKEVYNFVILKRFWLLLVKYFLKYILKLLFLSYNIKNTHWKPSCLSCGLVGLYL